MQSFRSLVATGALIAVGLVLTPCNAVAETSGADAVVLETDFSGRPPFKRRVVADDASKDVEPVRTLGARVDFRGAPPYKRHAAGTEPAETAEFARFEATAADATPRRTRRGPPGKLTSRR